MQRLADELAAEGLVEFIDNPRHPRSRLVRLTRAGEARYREMDARLLAIASTMGTWCEAGLIPDRVTERRPRGLAFHPYGPWLAVPDAASIRIWELDPDLLLPPR
jgi:DNA-binding MarR family transcriptional regulator